MAATTFGPGPSASKPTATLRQALMANRLEVGWRSVLNPIERTLPAYDDTIRTARRLGAQKKFHVVVIGQNHAVYGLTDAQMALVIQCQARVLHELEHRAVPVVASENLEWPVVRLSVVRSMIAAEARRYGHGDPAGVEQGYRFLMDTNGALSYLDRHHNVSVISTETAALHAAHLMTLQAPPTQNPGAVGQLQTQLRIVRSEMALVHLLRWMNQHHQSTGAIVIGSYHLPDLRALAHLYPGVTFEFVDYSS